MYELLNINNYQIPSVGLGLWKINKLDTANVVTNAIEIGYRHLDSAADYGNEKEVGAGLAEAINKGYCAREEVWITSKLWNNYHRKEHVRPACERTLKDLGLDYIDLYLIHFPISLQFVSFKDQYPPGWIINSKKNNIMKIDPVPLSETWQGMEELVQAGLVRHIGICNYNSGLLNDLMAYASIKPAMLQIESHPYLTQENLIHHAHNLNIAVTAFSPLGSLSYVSLKMAKVEDSLLKQREIIEIADILKRTPAQVVLRWGIQRKTAIIPKTSRIEKLRENISLFDFELNADQMNKISALNINYRFNDPANFCEKAFGKFYSIYD